MSGEHKQKPRQEQRQLRAEEPTSELRDIYRDIVQRLVGKRLALLVLGGEPGALESEPQERTKAEEEQLRADVKAMVEANRKAEFRGPYRLDYVDGEGYLHSIVKGKGCDCGSSSCPLVKMLSEDFRWEPVGDARPRDHAKQVWDDVTNPEGPYHNEACANCGVPRDLHKEPGDLPSGSLNSTWGDVDSCRDFQRCDPPRVAYGDAWWAEEEDATGTPDLHRVVIRHEGDDPGHGTKLYIDGFEVPELTNVSFSHPVGEIAQVKAQVNALRNFELDVRADVAIEITAFEGEIISEPLPDGRVRYKTAPEAKRTLWRDVERKEEYVWICTCGRSGPQSELEGPTGYLQCPDCHQPENLTPAYPAAKEGVERESTVLPHPFLQGFEAFLAGQLCGSNPHPREDSGSSAIAAWKLWEQGFRVAEAASSEGGAS